MLSVHVSICSTFYRLKTRASLYYTHTQRNTHTDSELCVNSDCQINPFSYLRPEGNLILNFMCVCVYLRPHISVFKHVVCSVIFVPHSAFKCLSYMCEYMYCGHTEEPEKNNYNNDNTLKI